MKWVAVAAGVDADGNAKPEKEVVGEEEQKAEEKDGAAAEDVAAAAAAGTEERRRQRKRRRGSCYSLMMTMRRPKERPAADGLGAEPNWGFDPKGKKKTEDGEGKVIDDENVFNGKDGGGARSENFAKVAFTARWF